MVNRYETASCDRRSSRGIAGGYERRFGGTASVRDSAAPAESALSEELDTDFVDCIGVPVDQVPIMLLKTVDLVLGIGQRELGLPAETKILWYRHTEPGELGRLIARRRSLGFHESDNYHRCWIRVDQTQESLVNTVAHELRHVYQALSGRFRGVSVAVAEADAERWAELVMDHVIFADSGMPLAYV